jgi:hypothetical protein
MMARRRPYDPLAPLTPKAQSRRAMSYILPAIAALNAEFDRRAAVGQEAIRGYTDQAAGQLAPIAGTVHSGYASAIDQQRADDAALAARLAALGSPEAAGAAATSQGIGSTGLTNLLAHGAAAEGYAAQLPGFARLAGVQHAGQFGAQIESQRAGEASRLRQQIPNLVQHIADQQLQASIAGIGLGYKQAAVAETARGHTLTYKARIAAINAANKRTGMTLKQRAAANGRSIDEQTRHDQAVERQNAQKIRISRRKAWYAEQIGNWKRAHPGASQAVLDAYIAGLPKKKK